MECGKNSVCLAESHIRFIIGIVAATDIGLLITSLIVRGSGGSTRNDLLDEKEYNIITI